MVRPFALRLLSLRRLILRGWACLALSVCVSQGGPLAAQTLLPPEQDFGPALVPSRSSQPAATPQFRGPVLSPSVDDAAHPQPGETANDNPPSFPAPATPIVPRKPQTPRIHELDETSGTTPRDSTAPQQHDTLRLQAPESNGEGNQPVLEPEPDPGVRPNSTPTFAPHTLPPLPNSVLTFPAPAMCTNRQDGEFWIVSSRNCPRKHGICGINCCLNYYHNVSPQMLLPADQGMFLNGLDPTRPLCIVVHGSYNRWGDIVKESRRIYQWIRAATPGEPPQVAFFTWPSDGNFPFLFPLDIALLGRRSSFHSLYLAQLINQLPPGQQVSFVGHSHGARTVAATLHLLAGGCIEKGFRLVHGPIMPRPIRAVFIAAAMDHHWLNPGERYGHALCAVERLLNMRNPKDATLVLYPLRKPFGTGSLGFKGLRLGDQMALAELNQKIVDVDVSRFVKLRHGWAGYTKHPELAPVMAPFLQFREEIFITAPAFSSVQPPAHSIPPMPTPGPGTITVPGTSTGPGTTSVPGTTFVPGTNSGPGMPGMTGTIIVPGTNSRPAGGAVPGTMSHVYVPSGNAYPTPLPVQVYQPPMTSHQPPARAPVMLPPGFAPLPGYSTSMTPAQPSYSSTIIPQHSSNNFFPQNGTQGLTGSGTGTLNRLPATPYTPGQPAPYSSSVPTSAYPTPAYSSPAFPTPAGQVPAGQTPAPVAAPGVRPAPVITPYVLDNRVPPAAGNLSAPPGTVLDPTHRGMSVTPGMPAANSARSPVTPPGQHPLSITPFLMAPSNSTPVPGTTNPAPAATTPTPVLPSITPLPAAGILPPSTSPSSMHPSFPIPTPANPSPTSPSPTSPSRTSPSLTNPSSTNQSSNQSSAVPRVMITPTTVTPTPAAATSRESEPVLKSSTGDRALPAWPHPKTSPVVLPAPTSGPSQPGVTNPERSAPVAQQPTLPGPQNSRVSEVPEGPTKLPTLTVSAPRFDRPWTTTPATSSAATSTPATGTHPDVPGRAPADNLGQPIRIYPRGYNASNQPPASVSSM